jgi:hypothetical protein
VLLEVEHVVEVEVKVLRDDHPSRYVSPIKFPVELPFSHMRLCLMRAWSCVKARSWYIYWSIFYMQCCPENYFRASRFLNTGALY